ncbi:MAG: 16S rRNA (guanine(527)-N(7))-methyltransferase RsmG [Alphaproteobacteria bacterium]|nr:16S rRNA (guanine(527)-N(7))-methyltransferase RsmG [Alphaproteobacteria bacterium]
MTLNEKFDSYEHILREWNTKINLVASSTLDDIRGRHILDSAQLAEYIPHVARANHGVQVIDLGSGAGFPAVILAILGFDVIAIESITKKCVFLEELKYRFSLPHLQVKNNRIEAVLRENLNQDYKKIVFTARAFASLLKIFGLTFHIPGEYVLLKGASVKEEIAAAGQKYDFDYELFPSKTGSGYILRVKNLKKKTCKKPRFLSKKPGITHR